MEVRLYLGKNDRIKYKFLIIEFQLICFLFLFKKPLKKIKVPEILHICLYEDNNRDLINGSASDPHIFQHLKVNDFAKLPIDVRFKKVLKIINKSYLLMTNYLKTKDIELNPEIFKNIYEEWSKRK